MSIAFVAEAPLGCELTVTHTKIDNAHYFRTLRGDGAVNAEARIVLG
jgi:hypothetical protein